jgi:PIN domain nuclease of toxin-antitoxin system
VIYLDTHVLVALYAGESHKLSPAGRQAVAREELVVSPAAILELEFLYEIRRLKTAATKLISGLAEQIGLRICELPFSVVVNHALSEKWGRDPFDRLIVANAKANNAPLLTRDERIHKHYSRAIW